MTATTIQKIDHLTVTPEPLPKLNITRYTQSDCYILAGAIHDLTGWPPALLSADNGETGHVVTVMPDGRYLDVRGTHTALTTELPDAALTILTSVEDLGWGATFPDDETQQTAVELLRLHAAIATTPTSMILCDGIVLGCDDDGWYRR